MACCLKLIHQNNDNCNGRDPQRVSIWKIHKFANI